MEVASSVAAAGGAALAAAGASATGAAVGVDSGGAAGVAVADIENCSITPHAAGLFTLSRTLVPHAAVKAWPGQSH